jgi:phospholipid/cholesterol/gamma-HCH transport system ATP-binding protein
MVIVTHDVHGARKIADRFAVLDEGKLIALGKPQELENHKSETVRKLVTEN